MRRVARRIRRVLRMAHLFAKGTRTGPFLLEGLIEAVSAQFLLYNVKKTR